MKPDPKKPEAPKVPSAPTPLPELIADREAIRQELKRDRKRKTVRVQIKLP